MGTVHLIVQLAHGQVGEQSGQFGEGLPQGRVGLKTFAPHGQATVVRREIPLVIPEEPPHPEPTTGHRWHSRPPC